METEPSKEKINMGAEKMEAKVAARIAYQALEDKKGEDIKIIDISNVSVLADYFIIANGNNKNQVQALVDNVQEELDKVGVQVKQVEGYRMGDRKSVV